MRKYRLRSFISFSLACLASALCADAAWAKVRLPAFFSDHMVLQQGVATPIWGWADPGEKVNVELAGQKLNATADDHGKWTVKTEPLKVGDPFEITVTGTNTLKINDVLVGEVWLCSGQSNMGFVLSGARGATEEIASADHPLLRAFMPHEQFGQEPKDDLPGQWKICSPKTAASFSAVAYYFGRDLQKHLGVPVGLLISTVGGTRIESWTSRPTLEAEPDAAPLLDAWKGVSPEEFKAIEIAYRTYQKERDSHAAAVAAAKASGEAPPPAPKAPAKRCHDCPSALFDGMIAPLVPYSIKGVVWYQGESNSGTAKSYRKIFPAMIANWRELWGEGNFPFLFVQVAPFKGTTPDIRDAQLNTWRTVPNTAMTVTADVGEADNVHPKNKAPVGARLCLDAQALAYGENIEYSGPLFDSMTIEGSKAILTFTHTGTGLMSKGETLKGFTIAGADGKFVPVTASIEGDKVIVTAEGVNEPKAVRYGWAGAPDVNLFNKEDLPASPFKTDEP